MFDAVAFDRTVSRSGSSVLLSYPPFAWLSETRVARPVERDHRCTAYETVHLRRQSSNQRVSENIPSAVSICFKIVVHFLVFMLEPILATITSPIVKIGTC